MTVIPLPTNPSAPTTTPTKKTRSSGEGTIFQRGDGLYAASISLGKNAEGKRLRRTVYGQTRAEVAGKLKEIKKEAELGVTRNSQETVASFLDRWLEASERNLRSGTLARYQSIVRLYIAPNVGHLVLSKLQPLQIEGLLSALSKPVLLSGPVSFVKGARRKTLSPQSIRFIYGMLRTALQKAVAWKLIPFNPVLGVSPPRVEKKEMAVWTAEQAKAFLAGVAGRRCYPLWLMALHTGLRIGELMALDWSDVALDAGVLRVKHTLTSRGPEVGKLAPTKTQAGVRSITLPPDITEALKAHKERLQSEGLEGSVLFPSRTGERYWEANLRRMFYTETDRLGLPRIRVHDLRHTNATLLIAAGVDVKTVQVRLGHSRSGVTMDTYAKFTKAGDDKAAVTIAGLLK